ncbi:MAG: hypothetical protein HYW25_04145 [Candidatus Aenigmarchaeota archaeon]|nr:hypothetical protein [Candidatus Aenigmarchaeota archaeon]
MAVRDGIRNEEIKRMLVENLEKIYRMRVDSLFRDAEKQAQTTAGILQTPLKPYKADIDRKREEWERKFQEQRLERCYQSLVWYLRHAAELYGSEKGVNTYNLMRDVEPRLAEFRRKHGFHL